MRSWAVSRSSPFSFVRPNSFSVIIRLFNHFAPEPVPSIIGVWIVAFVNPLRFWVTKFKPSSIFCQLSALTSNNVIWVHFSAILFDETQCIVKTSTTGYVPVCYEVINLLIKPQNFQLMLSICKLKGLYLIIFFFNGWG